MGSWFIDLVHVTRNQHLNFMKELKSIEELPEGTVTLVDSNLLGDNLITRQILESWDAERMKRSLEDICLQVDYHWDEEWFDFKFFLSNGRIPSQGDFYFKEGIFRIPVATFEDGLDILFFFINQWKYDNYKEKNGGEDTSNLPDSLFPFRIRFHEKLAEEIKRKDCPAFTLFYLQLILLRVS